MYAMDVPTTKLIVLNPAIITIQHNEDRINIRSNHGADLVLDCPACVHLKAAVKNLAQLILRWLAAHITSSVCVRDEEQSGKKARPSNSCEYCCRTTAYAADHRYWRNGAPELYVGTEGTEPPEAAGPSLPLSINRRGRLRCFRCKRLLNAVSSSDVA